MPWSDYLPLSQPSDMRRRLTTPETAIQLSAAPDAPFGVSVSGNIFTSGIVSGLPEWTAVRFETTGVLPAPIVANVTYYIRDTTDVLFTIASVIGGSTITITDPGSGQLSIRNWGLNEVLESKISLADEYIYDQLLALVMDHIRPWSMNTFYGFFPIVGYDTSATRTPRDRAVVVLDNLINPETLVWASCDTTMWLMTLDGANRNQVSDALFEQYRGQSLEKRNKILADESIAAQARLLMVDTASGAFGLFNFDQVTDSITVSLL